MSEDSPLDKLIGLGRVEDWALPGRPFGSLVDVMRR
jgi:hypothetical protein